MSDDDNEVVVIRNTSITDPNFVYINNVSTDILRTFRKMGWIPPSELKIIKAAEEAALVKEHKNAKVGQ
jgi:hypothetical protein